MKKIIRPRQAGKSSELIRIAEETNAYIIVATRARAVCLADMAQKQGRHILYPVTLREYEQSRFRGSYIRHVLIDDADAVLEQVFKEVTIDAITMTECVMEQEPSEDVQPVVPAHWIDQGHKIFKCSNCGNYLDFRGANAGRGTANYCPNCGAKMRNILTRKPQKQKLTKREEEIRDYIIDEYGETLYGAEVHYTPETVARVDEASKILGKIFDILGYKEENMSDE